MKFHRICDRCGFKYLNTQTRKEWTGLMVCFGAGTNACWEPQHPQDFVRGVKDNEAVPDPRPDSADVFLDPGDVIAESL